MITTMRTRLGDFIWLVILVSIAAIFLYPRTQTLLIDATQNHPYIMGFIKFSILATMGELLAIRIVTKKWGFPVGLAYRSIVWGMIGAGLVIVFGVYGKGVVALIDAGLLPAGRLPYETITTAFWISVINNLSFAPTLMLSHKLTDTYLDLANGKLSNIQSVTLSEVVSAIDWRGFLDLVIFKAIPLFWIPAHTITFFLPPEYRVLFAALLSIALGGILGYAKRGIVSRPAAF
jgi:hypothetical protein